MAIVAEGAHSGLRERGARHSRLCSLWEATAGAYKKLRFNPLELEIIDRVHELAWEQIEARDIFRDKSKTETANRLYGR